MRQFMEASHDGIKAGAVFNTSSDTWKNIRPAVKLWVKSNYDDWIEQRPPWFTDDMRAKIPLEMIPTKADKARMKSLKNMYSSAENNMMRDIGRKGRRNSQFGMSLTTGGFVGLLLAKVAPDKDDESNDEEESGNDRLLKKECSDADLEEIFKTTSSRFI